MTQHYDVAFIGAQPSGIIAAALLAKRHRRVLLIDHGEEATSYSRNGIRLPLVPYIIPNLETSPAITRVHEELGLGPEIRAHAKPLSPAFQAVMPRHRFDIVSDAKKLRAELALEFPDVASAVDGFLTRLFAMDDEITAFLQQNTPVMPQTLGERWHARSWISRAKQWDAPFEKGSWLTGIPEDHPVRDALLSPLAFFSHLAPQTPSTFQAVRLIARYFRGTVDFDEELGGLFGLLFRAAKQAGVDVRQGAEVRSLAVKGKVIQQLEIEGDRLPYTADFYVANTFGPFQELLELSSANAGRLAAEDQEVRPVGSLLVLNMVARGDVIPCGMGQAVFLLNGRTKPRGDIPPDPPILVQRHPVRHESPALRQVAPPPAPAPAGKSSGKGGKHGSRAAAAAAAAAKRDAAAPVATAGDTMEILSAACPVRTADVIHSPERLAAIKTAMVERIARLVPFLRNFVVDTSLAADTTSWDLQAADAPRRIDPWRLHPLYESARRPLLGIAARGPRTYFKNLWHAGRDVLPGLGIEGEYMTGLTLADAVIRAAGSKWGSGPSGHH